MTEAEFATQFEGSKKTSGLFELGGWRGWHFPLGPRMSYIREERGAYRLL